MKGLFRGLRCLFDTNDEKEPEIQIGAPTDVKHVAHIGCDGPSTPAPSWMNEYQSGSEAQSGETGSEAQSSRQHKSRQIKKSSHGNDSPNHHRPRKNKSNTSESSADNVKRTRKKRSDGTTRSSKNKNKDPSDYSDSNCSDGVCRKPVK
ncbi:uncharacterized protein [Rutidosis leptorrhynchoides]|uniref:uncharacterized protein n=1 Tax=Rutidosis leptorrhynchoides TaxID=125765 RepID=UPI003A9918D8